MRKFYLAQASGVAIALFLHTGSQAQTAAQAAPRPAAESDQSGTVGEVVVTSRKREERIVDVPETVVAISSDGLKTAGIVDFNSLGHQTPGLVMSKRQNNGTPDVVMRGVGSFGNVQGVGFYVDDVENFTDQTMRLQDVDHIEILKGPQGTLFGGSSLGGAIRYISKLPTFDPSAEVEAELGTQNYEDVYASANMPLVQDKVAMRLAAYLTHDDGFSHDVITGLPTSPLHEFSIRGQWLLKPTANFTALLTLRTHDVDGGAYGYAPQNSVTSPSFSTYAAFTPLQDTRVWAGVLNLGYDLGFASLSSITSATSAQTKLHVDASYGKPPATVVFGPDTRPTKVYTEEVRLTSKGNDKISWILGATAGRYENAQLNPSPLNLVFNGITIPNYFNYNNVETDLALFGSADFHFDRFTLTTGLRLHHADYESAVYYYGGALKNQDKSVKDFTPLPRVSLAYKTEWNMNLYGSVSEGYESGKVDPTASPSHPYLAEKAWTYELGAKGTVLDGGLYYEVAAFYIDDRDRQYTDFVTDSHGLLTKTVDNIGNATTKGAEIGLNWKVTPGLTLTGSTSYLNSRWNPGAVYNLVSVAGKTVPNTPDWTANMGATHISELPGGYKLSLHADGSYMGSFPWRLSYAPISDTNPAYWLLDGRVSVSSPDGRWEFAVRGDNILNKKYYSEFHSENFGPQNADGTCNGCHLGFPGAGQRFVASVDMKF